MIKHVFLFGVIIPTTVTIVFFIGFLICWFKFNIKERFFKKHFCKWHMKPNLSTQNNDPSVPVKVTYNRNHTLGSHADHNDPNDRDLDPGQGSHAMFPYQTQMRYTLPLKDRARYEFDGELCSNCSMAGDVDSNSSLNFSSQPEIHAYREKDKRVTDTPLSPKMTLPPQPNLDATIGQSNHGLIQQTFHFPVASGNQLKCIPLDGAEPEPCAGSEDGNYGHFVPKSCIECGHTKCPSRNHPVTLQETHFPADKAHCVHRVEHVVSRASLAGYSDDSQCGSEYSGSDISGIHLIATNNYHSNIPNISG